jgi:hypothetical protein
MDEENATQDTNLMTKYHMSMVNDFLIILRNDGYVLRLPLEDKRKQKIAYGDFVDLSKKEESTYMF